MTVDDVLTVAPRNKVAECSRLGIKPPLFICAPMVRYSKLPFRKLVRRYNCDLAYTPMIYASNFVASELSRAAEFSTDDDDWPIAQFAANEPSDFASAAEMLYGKTGCGSKLLENPEVIADIVKQTRARISDPEYSVSVKIRIKYPIERTVDMCRQIESCGVTHIAVHGRTVAMRAEPADYEAIRLIKSSLSVPVYANGGVNSFDKALEVAALTGADGVMVAEGLLSNPALFAGYDKTPNSCITDWIDIAEKLEVPYLSFHRHTAFMTHSLLTKKERLILHDSSIKCKAVLRMGSVIGSIWLLFLCIACAVAIRVKGTWDSNERRMVFVTKFGVGPVDKMYPDYSRGFVYGNVTNYGNPKNGGNSDVSLFVVPQTRINALKHESIWKFNCQKLLQNISSVTFEPRCFNQGKHRGDFMRWIPCPKDRLCIDEVKPSGVMPGSQFTFRIDEPYVPEYWYIVLVACRLDANCSWTETSRANIIEYDITLTNGHPLYGQEGLSKHFSFEEQNVMEILAVSFFLFSVLSLVQWRSWLRTKLHGPPLRVRLATAAIFLELSGLIIQVLNMFYFANYGSSFETVNFVADFLRQGSVCVICLLLLLLGNGWSLQRTGNRLAGECVFHFWVIFSVMHMALFSYGYLFVEEQRNFSDFLILPTANAIILIRILQGLWFLIAVKRTLRAEVNIERSVFLVHFGAAYMVWFTYYLLLVLVSFVVSEFYRIKLVLSVTTFANFVALTCLVHIFWPSGSYRKFFTSDLMMHRTFSNASSGGETDEYDLFLNGMHSDDEPDRP